MAAEAPATWNEGDEMVNVDRSESFTRSGRSLVTDRPAPRASERPDYRYRAEGTLVLFWTISQAASEWWAENVDPEAQRFGSAYVVEARYASDIVSGLAADGLVGGTF